MCPAMQLFHSSSQGAVSTLVKPDNIISLIYWQMPSLLGLFLWAIIQVQGRSGFHKRGLLLISLETGGFRAWEQPHNVISCSSYLHYGSYLPHCRGVCHSKSMSLKYFYSRNPLLVADWGLFTTLIVLLL